MTDRIEIQIPHTSVNEGSAFTATAYFRDEATQAALSPTTAEYRIDCIETGNQVKDWTTLTPGESVSISITSTDNAIISDGNRRELKQLTVAADRGLSTQSLGRALYRVENLTGVV